MSDTDTEFPVPLARFLASLQRTPDEIWSKHLSNLFKGQNATPTAWRARLDALKAS